MSPTTMTPARSDLTHVRRDGRALSRSRATCAPRARDRRRGATGRQAQGGRCEIAAANPGMEASNTREATSGSHVQCRSESRERRPARAPRLTTGSHRPACAECASGRFVFRLICIAFDNEVREEAQQHCGPCPTWPSDAGARASATRLPSRRFCRFVPACHGHHALGLWLNGRASDCRAEGCGSSPAGLVARKSSQRRSSADQIPATNQGFARSNRAGYSWRHRGWCKRSALGGEN